jgi:hypothetical protein
MPCSIYGQVLCQALKPTGGERRENASVINMKAEGRSVYQRHIQQ